MPDIFISYKKEEREVAALLATRLTEAGYDVWWDDALLAGERFEDEISAVLDEARVVVVLWSVQSVKSDWVKAEAESARQQKKALPVIIDDLSASKMPLLYRGMHAARLTGWTGETTHTGYIELIGSIKDRLGRATGPKLSEPQAEAKLEKSAEEARQVAETKPPQPRRSPLRWIVASAVALIVIAGAAIGYMQFGMIPSADRDAMARCTIWSQSAKLDWATGLPRLDATTIIDCETAAKRLPEDGDTLGRLAMVRALEGPLKSGEAIALANRGVEKKSAVANYVLAALYQRGIGLQADANRAATYYKAAHDLGLIRATGELCLLAIDAGGMLPVASNPLDTVSWCNTASEKGDALGQIGVAYLFETNFNGQALDPAKAASLYQLAADQGNDEAAVRLGILYSRGLGVTADFGHAVELFQRAADNGDPAGLRSLGLSLELGNGITQDMNRAAQLYETASIRRDIPALLLAGYGLAQGAVLTIRAQHDVELLAAPPNIVTAHRVRGQLLSRGLMRTLDIAAAEKEYKACADVGNSLCQVALGYFYEFGFNGTRDATKALPLYQAAADFGNMYGQYWLAYMYDAGDGVAADQPKAIQYYRLAAAQGHLTAINRLSQLGQPLQSGG
jgi:TPR repeat protein